MDSHSSPYRWYILFSLGFFLLITFIFFAVASKSEPKVTVIDKPEIELIEPTITIVNPNKGSADAKVTFVTFSDFTCEACGDLAKNLSLLQLKYPNDVRVVWKDLPNESLHDEATPSAIAARCAQEQDAFWTYHDELFLRQTNLSKEVYAQIASDLELNTKKFASCYDSQETLPRVKKDFDEGLALKITATPTIFVGSERLTGAISYSDLETIVKTLTGR